MSEIHTCSVCCGNGLVPNGFYRQVSGEWMSSDATPETCQSCSGKGYVIIDNPTEMNVLTY